MSSNKILGKNILPLFIRVETVPDGSFWGKRFTQSLIHSGAVADLLRSWRYVGDPGWVSLY